FIAKALKLIREHYPQSRLHAFGAGGPRTFPAVYAIGADSGDSIGWRQAAGFGSIFLPFRSQRTIRWRRGSRPPRKTLTNSDRVELANCECPVCSKQSSISGRVKALR